MEALRVSKPKVCKFNSIISTHAKHGMTDKAFDAFLVMVNEGSQPDTATFLSLLKVPVDLKHLPFCRSVHDCIVKFRFESDLMIFNALVHTYSKLGSLCEACQLFESSSNRDTITWGAIMFAHIQHGHGAVVIELFRKFQLEGLIPDGFIYISILKACKIAGSINQVISIHADLVKRGIEVDLSIGNTLIDVYVKRRSLDDAKKVFHDMSLHDCVSWGALIEGFSSYGHGYYALELFESLQRQGIRPNKVILLFVMKACSMQGYVEQGMILHDQIIRSAFELDLAFGSVLVEFYSICGKLEEAHKTFSILPNKDAATWGAMIGGYVQLGQGIPALRLFHKLQRDGIMPTSATFSSTLKACGIAGALSIGRQVHHDIIEKGLQYNGVIAGALADMYAKCGNFIEAQSVLDELCSQDVISWGAMIARHATQGHSQYVLDLFQKMHAEGVKPIKTIFLCVLKMCSLLADLSFGNLIHSEIIENGLEKDLLVGNALINLYVKGGTLDDAQTLFNNLPSKDTISWNTIMAGYTLHGHDISALKFAESMHMTGIGESKATYSNILKACASIGAVFQGKIVHNWIVKDGFESNMVIGSALVDMYTKCGYMRDAEIVFDELPKKDIVSWGSMTAGYALHGNFMMAKECFLVMQQQGMHLSRAVFTNMLVAFTHAGLHEVGCDLFRSVSASHCNFLDAEHYSCMVDLLGRTGQLDSAGDFFRSMPLNPSIPAWRSLLTSCRTHGSAGIGELCFDQTLECTSVSACG